MTNLTRDDLGAILHTAARKCMDSTQSVAVWNMIQILPPKVWIEYLDTVWEVIKDKSDDFTDVVSKTSCDWIECAETLRLNRSQREYYDWRDDFKKDNGYCYAYTLEAIFKLFSDEDWHGYCYWLNGGE